MATNTAAGLIELKTVVAEMDSRTVYLLNITKVRGFRRAATHPPHTHPVRSLVGVCAHTSLASRARSMPNADLHYYRLAHLSVPWSIVQEIKTILCDRLPELDAEYWHLSQIDSVEDYTTCPTERN